MSVFLRIARVISNLWQGSLLCNVCEALYKELNHCFCESEIMLNGYSRTWVVVYRASLRLSSIYLSACVSVHMKARHFIR